MPEQTPSDQSVKSAQPPQDEFERMRDEIRKDQERLKKRLQPNNIQGIITEINGTIMAYLREAADKLTKVRNWAAVNFESVDERLTAIETDLLLHLSEEDEESSGLEPEELDLLLRIVGKARALAETQLEGHAALPDPTKGLSEQAQAELHALIEECEQAVALLSQYEEEESVEEPQPDQASEPHA